MTASTRRKFEQLKAALLRRPFAPFAIVGSDGTKYRVTRPLQAGMSESQVAYLSSSEQFHWFKWTDVIAIEQGSARSEGSPRGKSR